MPPLPETFRHILPAARWERITHGHSGAQVWRSTRHVLKVQPHVQMLTSTLQQERERLRWLAGRIPAPQVLGYEVTPEYEFLAMSRLGGIPMSDPDATLHPERMVSLLARALRELHALPLRECPFVMSLNVTLPLARERVAAGLVDATALPENQSAISVFNTLARSHPAHEDLVVTHGDACLPNFMVQGEWLSGVLDVGRLGIADRHADLALSWNSMKRNVDVSAAEALLDAYGRERIDPQKLEYYLLLDKLL